MPHRILGNELQQARIAKIISPLEYNVLPLQPRMLRQIRPQSRRISRIDQIHGSPKYRIFNSLVMQQVELIHERRPLNMPLQPCPTWKSSLARNGELRVAELECGRKDFRISSPPKSRMKLANSLRRARIVGSTFLH